MGQTGRVKLEASESGMVTLVSAILALTAERLSERLLNKGLDLRLVPRDNNSGAASETEERKAS
jgi:hypothetical protein